MLSPYQATLLKDYLSFPISEMKELKDADALEAFQAIKSGIVSEKTKKFLQEKNVWDSVNQIRAILNHPCPQNRNVGDPSAASQNPNGVIGNKVYWWKNGFGSTVLSEDQGLLGLTAKGNDEASPVTKTDVINYINQIIDAAIAELKEKLPQEKLEITQGLQFFNQPQNTSDLIQGEKLLNSYKYKEYILNNLNKGECNNLMIALGNDFISINSLGYSPIPWLKAYCTDNVISALKEGLVPAKSLGFFTRDYLKITFSNNGLIALRDKLITIDHISKLPLHYLEEILTTNGLAALRDKHITVEQISKMTIDDLRKEISQHVPHNHSPNI